MRRLLPLLLLCLVSRPDLARAAFGIGADIVYDPWNHFENIATVVNTAATVRNLVEVIENQVKDLEPLTALAVAAVAMDVAQELDAIRTEGLTPLGTGQLRTVFDNLFPTGASMPCTPLGLDEWHVVVREQFRNGLFAGMRMQDNIYGLARTLETVIAPLLQRLLGLIGNLSGLQHQTEMVSQVVGEIGRMSGIAGMHSYGTTFKDLFGLTQRNIEDCISREIRRDLPRRVPFPVGGGVIGAARSRP